MWGSLILAPIIGILIDRIGGKWLFVTIGCAGIAALLYLMSWFTGQATLISILIGVAVAMVPPAIFSFPAELLPERLAGLGFGIIGTIFGVGVFLGPYVAGFLRDATGRLPLELYRYDGLRCIRGGSHASSETAAWQNEGESEVKEPFFGVKLEAW